MNRRNTEDNNGRSWYVKSNGRDVAGPFGSRSYASKVARRLDDRWEITAITAE